MKRYILILAAVLIGVLFVAAPHTFAAAADDICKGVGYTGTTNATCTDTTTLTGVVKKIVSVLSIIVGVTAVIFIIVGGFKFITSSGDAQKTAGARNTIIYAVVGLVVAVLAQAIVFFVLTNLK